MSSTQDARTYRTLDEQMEKLTPAEQRFERARQTIGLFAGPIVFVVMLLIPMGDRRQPAAAGRVLAFTIVYWLSEAIPIPATAILSLALCVLLQVPVIPADSDDSASDLVYGSFGSDTIFLFIGAFMIAQAMRTHGLDRRFAFRVLSLPGVAKSTYRLIIAFGAIAALISAFISNTATAAMLLPIGLGHDGRARRPGERAVRRGHRRQPAAVRHGADADDQLRRRRRRAADARSAPRPT